MSYWGSHYSALPKEVPDDEGDIDEADKTLCQNMNLTREQLDELKDCFKLCDKSGKGTISPMELKSLMKSVGEDPDDEDIHDIMLEIDLESKGEIDFIQFLQFMHKTIKAPIQDEVVEKCFNVFDSDENGYITVRGLERVFLSFGQQHTSAELKELISFVDTDDEEGLITLEHFKNYLVKEDLLRRKEEESDGKLKRKISERTRKKSEK